MRNRQVRNSRSRQLQDALSETAMDVDLSSNSSEPSLSADSISLIESDQRKQSSSSCVTVSQSVSSISSEPSQETLFNRLMTPRIRSENLADEWIQYYKNDRDSACRDFKDMTFRACGCSSGMPAEEDSTELLTVMTEHAPSGQYPLADKRPHFKKFRQALSAFLLHLIDKSQYSVVYDGFMLEQLMHFVWELANSDIRAFRHTGTFIALRFMTALVRLLCNVEKKLDSAERLRNAEKDRDKKHNKALTQNFDKLKENFGYLENFVTKTVTVVLVPRHCDVCPEIRLLVIEELRACMLSYPKLCLKDSNLKFLLPNLAHQNADLRLACLKSLDDLYSKDELQIYLHLFSEKSKRYLMALTKAPDDDTRMYAVRVLNKLDAMYPNALISNERSEIFDLVMSSNSLVAWETGKFLHRKCFAKSVDPTDVDELNKMAALSLTGSSEASTISNATSANAKCLHHLAKIVIGNSFVGMTDYFVDSLWHSSPMLRDWTTMIKLMLNAPDEMSQSQSQSMTTSVYLALVEILVSSARLTTCDDPPARRERPRQVKGPRPAVLQSERRRLSEILIPAYPLLLDRFSSNAEELALLLQLPAYFDLTIYTSSRLEKYLVDTLRCINDIFLRHVNAAVLEAGSKTLRLFCDKKYNVSARSLTALDTLVGSIRNSFVTVLKELGASDWSQDHSNRDLFLMLSSCIRKLAALFQYNDLSKFSLAKPMVGILKLATERQMPFDMPEIVEGAAKSAYMVAAWMAYQVQEEENEATLATLARVQEKLENYLVSILDIDEYRQAFDVVYACLCDMLVLFSPEYATQQTYYEPSSRSQDVIVKFVSDQLKRWTAVSDSSLESTSESVLRANLFKSDQDRWLALQKKRKYVALFGQLIAFGQLEVNCVVPLVRNFHSCNSDFGDLFKIALVKCREISLEETGKAIHNGLVSVYLVCMRKCGKYYSRNVEEMEPAQKLATLLAQSFGVDVTKVRNCVLALHRAGLSFVFGKNDGKLDDLPYLDLLQCFVPKLLLRDRHVIKAEFAKAIEALPKPLDCCEDFQEALRGYAKSVGCGIDDNCLAPPPPPTPLSCASLSSFFGNVADSPRSCRNCQASLAGTSQWSSPNFTSTAVRRGKRISEAGDDDDDDTLVGSVADAATRFLPVGGGNKASPAKRPRSVSAQAAANPWRPSSLSSRGRMFSPRAGSVRSCGTEKSQEVMEDVEIEGIEPLDDSAFDDEPSPINDSQMEECANTNASESSRREGVTNGSEGDESGSEESMEEGTNTNASESSSREGVTSGSEDDESGSEESSSSNGTLVGDADEEVEEEEEEMQEEDDENNPFRATSSQQSHHREKSGDSDEDDDASGTGQSEDSSESEGDAEEEENEDSSSEFVTASGGADNEVEIGSDDSVTENIQEPTSPSSLHGQQDDAIEDISSDG